MKKLKPVYRKMDLGGPGPRFPNLRRSLNDLDPMTFVSSGLQAGLKRHINMGGVGAKTSVGTGPSVDLTGDKPAGDLTGTKFSLSNAISGVKPYLSNIINSFSKPPMPRMPRRLSPVFMPRIDLSNQRSQVSRSARAADLQATNTLDEQTAAAVRNQNLAAKIQGLSQVNEAEANMNADQASRAAQINANIDAQNVANFNAYQDSLTGRKIAIQREQSANIANAADKSVMIDNEKAKRDLDLKKWGVLKDIWRQSGVEKRMMERLIKEGVIKPGELDPDVKMMGGRMKKVFADGGSIDSIPFYRKRMMASMNLFDRSSGDLKEFYRNEYMRYAGNLNRLESERQGTEAVKAALSTQPTAVAGSTIGNLGRKLKKVY